MAITFSVTTGQGGTNVSIKRSEINTFIKNELAKPETIQLTVEAEWNGILYPSRYSNEGVERLPAHSKVVSG